MIYKFKCEYCNTTEDVEMRMSEYTDEQYCPICNNKMVRDISSYTTAGAIWKTSGAYGKHSD